MGETKRCVCKVKKKEVKRGRHVKIERGVCEVKKEKGKGKVTRENRERETGK